MFLIICKCTVVHLDVDVSYLYSLLWFCFLCRFISFIHSKKFQAVNSLIITTLSFYFLFMTLILSPMTLNQSHIFYLFLSLENFNHLSRSTFPFTIFYPSLSVSNCNNIFIHNIWVFFIFVFILPKMFKEFLRTLGNLLIFMLFYLLKYYINFFYTFILYCTPTNVISEVLKTLDFCCFSSWSVTAAGFLLCWRVFVF